MGLPYFGIEERQEKSELSQSELSQFSAELGPETRFLKLHTNAKSPRGSLYNENSFYKALRPNRQYAILPGNRTLILDIDVRKGSPVDVQIAALEKAFDFSIDDTIYVRTPSGGVHIYLKLPEGFPLSGLPGGNARGLTSIIKEYLSSTFEELSLDLDFRRAGVKSYVVGPGSNLGEQGGYSLAPLSNGEIKISTLSELGAARISSLRRERKRVKAEPGTSRESRKSSARKSSRVDYSVFRRVEQPLPTETIYEIRQRISDRKTYHAKRAHVAALMQCCYTDEEIAWVCNSLKVNWDSHRNQAISDRDLMRDLRKLRETRDGTVKHGICKAFKASRKFDPVDYSRPNPRIAAKVKDRSLSRSKFVEKPYVAYRVVSLEKVSGLLSEVCRAGTAQYRNALEIMGVYAQAVLNAGGDRVVASREELSKNLGLTSSQVAQALRILGKSGALHVVNKQKPGLASTWGVPRSVIDWKRTQVLQELRATVTWGVNEESPNFVWNDENKLFVETHGERAWTETGVEVVSGRSEFLAYDVSKRYTAREADARAEQATLDPSPVTPVSAMTDDEVQEAFLEVTSGLNLEGPEVQEVQPTPRYAVVDSDIPCRPFGYSREVLPCQLHYSIRKTTRETTRSQGGLISSRMSCPQVKKISRMRVGAPPPRVPPMMTTSRMKMTRGPTQRMLV